MLYFGTAAKLMLTACQRADFMLAASLHRHQSDIAQGLCLAHLHSHDLTKWLLSAPLVSQTSHNS